MNTIIIVVAIIVVVSITNIYLSVDLYFDVIHNLGHIRLKVFGISVLSFDITIVGKYVTFSAKSDKVHRIKIDLYDKSFIFFEILFKKLKDKIVLRKFNIDGTFALSDVMAVSIFSGLLNIFTNYFCKLMQVRHSDADVSGNIQCGFRHRQIDFDMSLSITITIFDILTALLGTIYAFWRLGNEIKKQKAR